MKTDTLQATDLLFPKPSTIHRQRALAARPASLRLEGAALPVWLGGRLSQACRRAGVTLRKKPAAASSRIACDPADGADIADPALRAYGRALGQLTRRTGHDPCDSVVLDRWAKLVDGVPKLIDVILKERIGLPYFEKLLHFPDVHGNTSIEQLRTSNHFFAWFGDGDFRTPLPPPPR